MSTGHRSQIKRERNNRPVAPGRFTAKASNSSISPRKMRLSADLVRGRRVEEALTSLEFDTRRSSVMLRKIVMSAVASAQERGGLDPMDLRVTEILVGDAQRLKRWHVRGRGRVAQIIRRSCNVTVVVATSQEGA